MSAGTNIDFTVNPLPTATVNSNSPLCEGQTLNLTAAGANVDFAWSNANGFVSTVANPTITNVSEADHQGFYTLIVTDQTTGCISDPISVLVDVNKTPTNIAINSNSPICTGATLNLSTSVVGDATYTWSGPNGYTATTRNTTVTAAAAGTYQVVVNLNGCASLPATTDVTLFAVPAANAGTDQTIRYGESAVLHATGGFLYSWTPSLSLDNASVPNPHTVNNVPVGINNFVVTVLDANGCSATDDMNVVVTPDATESSFIDLITPNGDGVNDEWHVPFLANLTNYTLRIFARAGNEVYSTKSYTQDWKGTSNGVELPDGTYWYIIRLADGKEYKGAITIKR